MRDKLRNICLIVFVISIMLCIVSISYGYFKPVVDNIEDRSTIKLDGAEIYANYSSTSTIYVEDIEPSDEVIGYKDFSLEVKNTSSRDVSAYIYLDIIYSDYTDIENDGVLYYELVSDNNIIVDKTMIKAVSSGKALLYELVIPSNTSSTTINYRLNIYFPLSDKIQNLNKGEDGTMKFNGKIEVMNIPLLSDYIVSLYNSDEGKTYLKDDGTEDHNIRYYGSGTNADDVPNYVSFNNELWRIIGVFDTYNADTKEIEKSVKIIRNSYLGTDSTLANVTSISYTGYSWDTSINAINNGEGINAWNQAYLMEELNTNFLNKKSKTDNTELIENLKWFNAGNEYKGAVFYIEQIINNKFQKYIMNARWYLGGFDSNSISSSNIYLYERNFAGSKKTIPDKTCSGASCNDKVTREEYWDGKIALPYPSDFGFAAVNTEINNCSIDLSIYTNCSKDFNWMSRNIYEWTMTQYVDSSRANLVFSWTSKGYLYYGYARYDVGVRPTLYLTSNTLITGGNGTSSNPYQISLS